MQTEQIEILPCIKCGGFLWCFAMNGRKKIALIKCGCGHRGPEISTLDGDGNFRAGQGEQIKREAVEAWNREHKTNPQK